MMRVLFAPDWKEENKYQKYLSKALEKQGISVDFAPPANRPLPLRRAVAGRNFDLLHMHWPEAYFPWAGSLRDWFHRAAFFADLWSAIANKPMVYTAHNLLPHNIGNQRVNSFNMRLVARKANAIFAHSESVIDQLVQTFQVRRDNCVYIPHGDLSSTIQPLVTQEQARSDLGLNVRKLCLMFGAVEPYKGIEEIIDFWKKHKPDSELAIVGRPYCETYAASVRQRADNSQVIHLHLDYQPDQVLAKWLSAADCVIFNYHKILTSGAATLARSLGIPVVIPVRLNTVDLDEPDPRVFRFDNTKDDLMSIISAACAVGTNYDTAAKWREKTSWKKIADTTADVYRRVLESNQV